MKSMIQQFATWKEFREKYELSDTIQIYPYARKLLDDLHLPEYTRQTKIQTILKLQELRDLLPYDAQGMTYMNRIDEEVLKFE